jgi:hypothetical protein
MHRLDVKAPGTETALAASGLPAPKGHRLGRNYSKLTPQSDPRQTNLCGKHEAKGRIAPEVRRSALVSSRHRVGHGIGLLSAIFRHSLALDRHREEPTAARQCKQSASNRSTKPVIKSSSVQDLHYSSTDTVSVDGGRQSWAVHACTSTRSGSRVEEARLPFGRSALIATEPS